MHRKQGWIFHKYLWIRYLCTFSMAYLGTATALQYVRTALPEQSGLV